MWLTRIYKQKGQLGSVMQTWGISVKEKLIVVQTHPGYLQKCQHGHPTGGGGWVHLPVLKPCPTNAVVSLVYLQLNVLGKLLNLIGHRDTRHACTNTNGSNLLVSRVMQRDVRYHVGRVWSNPFFGGRIVAIMIARSRHCHGRHIENEFDLEKKPVNHFV